VNYSVAKQAFPLATITFSDLSEPFTNIVFHTVMQELVESGPII